MAENYQEKIREVVKYINKNLIAEVPRNIYDPEQGIDSILSPDGKLGRGKEKFVPITTTLLMLNSFLGNNTLIEGGSGTGKTKLASVAGSLLFQMPYELFERKRVVGTPGATVNEIYATHDLSELNRGNDVAFLYLPFYSPFLVIDELNRFSELEQNRIREGIAANTWNYANHSWIMSGKQLVVSAINPESYGGTFILNENLLDNYSITLEPAHYNALYHKDLVVGAEEKIKATLGLEEAVDELMLFYEKHKNEPKLIREHICDLQKKTLKKFQERKLSFVHNGDLDKIKKAIEDTELSPEGYLFFLSTLAEMTYSRQYGRLRYDDPQSDNSHDTKYISTKIKEGLAGRFLKNWLQTSKAIAWYFGKDKTEIEDIKAAFIYTANKRIKPEEDFFQEAQNNTRVIPVNFKMAKNLMETAWQNFADFRGKKDNENPAFNKVRKAVRILTEDEKGSFAEAIKDLQAADHPLAKSVLEAVALQEFYK